MDAQPTSTSIEEWQGARNKAVWGLFGIAHLTSTTWLSESAQAISGTRGQWLVRDGHIEGTHTGDPHTVRLSPGEAVEQDDTRIVAIERDGRLALRVFQPERPSREGLGRIERFPHDPAWIVSGTYVAFDAPLELASVAVDGHEGTASFDGEIRVAAPSGAPIRLLVRVDAGGLFCPFADETAHDGRYRFRMIRAELPSPAGEVTVDFNRAYLPPSSFSPAYLCVTPPEANHMPMRIEAGERGIGVTVPALQNGASESLHR